MGTQNEQNTFDATVYSYETGDKVLGGVGGVANSPLLNLANRTRWLYNQVTALVSAGYTTMAAVVNYAQQTFQPLLGFVPVQQGGANGQGTNKVIIGYDTSGAVPTPHLRATVDVTDLGTLALVTDVSGRRPFAVYLFQASVSINLAAGWYKITLSGAGGGGAAVTQRYTGGGGGASGDVFVGLAQVTTAGAYQFTCGAPGLGGFEGANGSNENGAPGGSSTFLGITAAGGNGGVSPDNSTARGAGGHRATTSGTTAVSGVSVAGYFKGGNDGGDGSGDQGIAALVCFAGNGAPSPVFGGAGRGGDGGGTSGSTYGAGGGGAYGFSSGGNQGGGNGYAGVLVIETLSAISPFAS